VPEQSLDHGPTSSTTSSWLKERLSVWNSDNTMLERSDKAMWQALKLGLHEESSPQWARYLRHKGLRPPAARGHSWKQHPDHQVDTTGTLLETSADSSNNETPKTQNKGQLCDKTVKQHHGYFKLKGPAKKVPISPLLLPFPQFSSIFSPFALISHRISAFPACFALFCPHLCLFWCPKGLLLLALRVENSSSQRSTRSLADWGTWMQFGSGPLHREWALQVWFQP